MTFFLPGSDTDLPAIEQPPSRRRERLGAAFDIERIETDAWSRSSRIETDVLSELETSLGLDPESLKEEFRGEIGSTFLFDGAMRSDAGRNWRIDRIVREAETRRAAGNEVPIGSREEFEAFVTDRRRAEWDEARAVLDAGPEGAWAIELLGRLGAGATDEATLATLPFGLGGSLSRVVVSETALGMLGEATILPRQFEVSEELDLPAPNVAEQLLVAGLTSGVLGGGIHLGIDGVARYRGYRQTREETAGDQAGRENVLDAEARVNEAAETLEGGAGPRLTMADFDYGRGGNADPNENRIGYVYGKLLEHGFEPHIAAGLTGNLMQESGVALDTRAIGDGGNAFGMGQWNGDRMRALKDFASPRDSDPADVDTQIAFLIHELETTEADAMARIATATTAEEAALIASREFWRPGIPHNANRVSYARSVQDQYDAGEVPRWTGPVATQAGDAGDFSPYRTQRGYTGEGQIAWGGEGSRIDVEYQVVDLATLRQATGDLQPRDRSRANSDAWVNDTAARLDPAQLMPAPTADRGTPIVGPDNIIESGNGRVRAIDRAYDIAPDRAAAYRAQIEATTGAAIPEGIERPVLVARRRTELDAPDRRRFVEEAQDSGVARMTATERARIGQRRLDADLMAQYVPGRRLAGAENRNFSREFIGAFPRSERNAFIADDAGTLSQDGVRQIQDSLFARAWDAPDIIAARTEAEAGDARQLIQALDDAAPAFAQLRAEIDAGLIRPEFDISGFVLDATRLILTARDMARREGGRIAELVDDLVNDADLFGVTVAPLTQALVKKFYKGGRIASAEKISEFLNRYADEARKAGRVSDALAGDPPDVLDVLKTIDGTAFGDLVETGLIRQEPARLEIGDDFPEFADGALSDDALAADQQLMDQLRPQVESFEVPDVQAWAAAQPFDDIDQLFDLAPARQSEFVSIAKDIEARIDGITFKDPGLKDRGEAEKKIDRKMYDSPRRLTDISRGGFTIADQAQADEIAAAFAEAFDVLDEGWAVNDLSGYVDRKLILRHEDGMLTEVQIWTTAMAKAKFGQGTELYTKWRALPNGTPEKAATRQAQIDLYSAAADADSIDIAAARSSSPKVLNRVRNASSDAKPVAVSATSSASTSTQPVLGDSIATARGLPKSRSDTVGRPSQFPNDNDMEVPPFAEDTPDMGAIRAEVNNLDDLVVTLEDGSQVSARGLLDELDRDADIELAIDACLTGGRS